MSLLYNSYETVPYIAYNIVNHLLKNEVIWKILKYDDYDALSKDDLTDDEKIDMIWRGQENQEDYNVFLTPMEVDIIDDSKTRLKIYDYMIVGQNKDIGILLMRFNILCFNKSTMIEYNGIPCSRLTVMKAELLKELNGADVGGVGVMEMNNELQRYCGSTQDSGNNKNVIGDTLTMALQISTLSQNRNGF